MKDGNISTLRGIQHRGGHSAQKWNIFTSRWKYFHLRVEIFPGDYPRQGGNISTKCLKTKPPYL